MVQTIGSGTDPIQSLGCEAYLPKLVILNSAILDFGRSNLFILPDLIDNSTVPYLRSARLKLRLPNSTHPHLWPPTHTKALLAQMATALKDCIF